MKPSVIVKGIGSVPAALGTNGTIRPVVRTAILTQPIRSIGGLCFFFLRQSGRSQIIRKVEHCLHSTRLSTGHTRIIPGFYSLCPTRDTIPKTFNSSLFHRLFLLLQFLHIARSNNTCRQCHDRDPDKGRQHRHDPSKRRYRINITIAHGR